MARGRRGQRRFRPVHIAISSDRSVRLRISDGRAARLTLKFGSDLFERDEFEYEVPLATRAR